jgi:phage terminase large subunit GpA-like protein
MLSPEASAEPGRWSTARAEYQRGIMDAIADPSVREIWVQKSAQVGWTEILGNAVGYFIDQDPSPMLLIQPTLDMAEAWSKDRFAPMLRDTPALKGLVKDARSRDSGNTLLHKQFPGGHITMAGANSRGVAGVAAGARGPVRRGRSLPGVGGNGRRPDQARAEAERDVLESALPRRLDADGERRLARRDRVREFGSAALFVPCTHCGERQVLKWAQVKWDEGKPETAAYVCEHCGVLLNDGDRVEMIRKGEWIADKPFAGIAGFHIWEAYSPWRKLAEIVLIFSPRKSSPS